MNDPYDNGTPKYSTAQDIYDALCVMVDTEEMSILSEIGFDVSWENQTYYYTDKGYTLKDEFERVSEYGDKMWLMDLAVMMLDGSDSRFNVHDIVFDALNNKNLAKRIGFKKLFVEHMLRGYDRNYAKISDDFLSVISELDRFDNYSMMCAFSKVMEENGEPIYEQNPYNTFAYYLHEKIRRLEIESEKRLIAECRAHLTSYDDFIFGLRVNQALHERQEQVLCQKVAALQAAYDEKVARLSAAAESAGLLPALSAELQRLEPHGIALIADIIDTNPEGSV